MKDFGVSFNQMIILSTTPSVYKFFLDYYITHYISPLLRFTLN